MIISLEDAQKVDAKIDQDDLDAFESSVRELTNNNFHNNKVRFKNVKFISENTIEIKEDIIGLRIGDTIEVNYSDYNNGLYVVDLIEGNEIKVEGTPFIVADTNGTIVTLVKYPADVKRGIKRLIKYDTKMSSKIGIKSETISRMSTTYYDVNSSENTEGYPSSLLSFLDKYKKMRW